MRKKFYGAVVLAALAVVVGLAISMPQGHAASVRTVASSRVLAPSATDQVVNGVDQSQLQQCIASGQGNCEDTVPGLKACMQAGLVCNEEAEQTMQSSQPAAAPPTQALSPNCVPFVDAPEPPPPGSTQMTASQAIAAAKSFTTAGNPSTHEFVVTASQWSDMCAPRGQAPTTGGLVWIVTVDAPYGGSVATFSDSPVPVANDPGSSYSIIIDDSSQAVLVLCTSTVKDCPLYNY